MWWVLLLLLETVQFEYSLGLSLWFDSVLFFASGPPPYNYYKRYLAWGEKVRGASKK